MTRNIRHSGLQLEVLALYKRILKCVYSRSPGPTRQSLLQHVRSQFREGATIRKSAIDVIERRLLEGRKQLKLLQLEGTESISTIQISNKKTT